MGPEGTRGDQRGPEGTRGDQRGPEGTRGDQRGPEGTRGDQRGPEGTRGDQRGPEGPAMAEINARTLMFNLGREDATDSTTSAKIARYAERKQLAYKLTDEGVLLLDGRGKKIHLRNGVVTLRNAMGLHALPERVKTNVMREDVSLQGQRCRAIREVKIATCTATCTCDVIVRVGGIPYCRCERVNLTFSTPSSPSTRSTGTAGENL